MSTDEFNSLTNFWINYDQNGNVVSVSDYFLDKVQIGSHILESFKFKRLYISKEDNSKISEKLAGKVFEALCSFNSMSFRFTSHKISGENLLTGWPKLEELSHIGEYGLADLMNHPCCLITDLLIMKDLIQKEQESSLEKEARAYQHKLSTISKLASGVGHEVNNPLMVIKGQVMALRKKRDKENDLEGKLGKIDKSIDKIANIAKSLRDFSQIGMTSIKKVNLNKLIKMTCSHLEELIEEKKIAIILDMPVEDIDILGDENRLQTCMTHLLLNSIDAIETSISKDIKISLTAEDDFCFLHIEDEGCGIPENLKDKIFEPFFTTKDVNQGTGIGLALVREIIRDHKGLITFESTLSRGSMFKIKMPLFS